mgnify:CR=1 FL=1
MYPTNTLSKKDIILDTIIYYKSHPRCKHGPGCAYNDEEGNHCAVGRYLKPEIKEEGVGWSMNNSPAYSVGANPGGSLDEVLVEEAQGHEIRFWDHLQQLHDNDQSWDTDENGITSLNEFGMSQVQQILKNDYANSPFTHREETGALFMEKLGKS